jgi:hypothetical protein
LALAALGSGCRGDEATSGDSGAAPTEPREEAVLVDMAAWQPGDVAVAPDPFPDHRPAEADCPEGGALLEGASFEIRTASCSYGWFQQPTLADLRPSDAVEIVFWHSTLVSDPPAQGHIALVVGDEVLYERYIDIPSEPAAYTETVAGVSAPAGSVATLHLHNHGANDWNLLRVERTSSP